VVCFRQSSQRRGAEHRSNCTGTGKTGLGQSSI